MIPAFFHEVPIGAIEKIFDANNNPWLWGQELEARQELEATQSTALGWFANKDQQNKTDKFLSVYAVMDPFLNSCNKKIKELRLWILKKTSFPNVLLTI